MMLMVVGLIGYALALLLDVCRSVFMENCQPNINLNLGLLKGLIWAFYSSTSSSMTLEIISNWNVYSTQTVELSTMVLDPLLLYTCSIIYIYYSPVATKTISTLTSVKVQCYSLCHLLTVYPLAIKLMARVYKSLMTLSIWVTS